MSSLILEPNASKIFFMKWLGGRANIYVTVDFLLKRDAAKMVDRAGSIFMLSLASKYSITEPFRACEICDENHEKKPSPETIYAALNELGCEAFVPTLQQILATSFRIPLETHHRCSRRRSGRRIWTEKERKNRAWSAVAQKEPTQRRYSRNLHEMQEAGFKLFMLRHPK